MTHFCQSVDWYTSINKNRRSKVMLSSFSCIFFDYFSVKLIFYVVLYFDLAFTRLKKIPTFPIPKNKISNDSANCPKITKANSALALLAAVNCST